MEGTSIGPYGLSGSMGKPGEYHDEAAKAALKQHEEIFSKYKKLLSYHVIESGIK